MDVHHRGLLAERAHGSADRRVGKAATFAVAQRTTASVPTIEDDPVAIWRARRWHTFAYPTILRDAVVRTRRRRPRSMRRHGLLADDGLCGRLRGEGRLDDHRIEPRHRR